MNQRIRHNKVLELPKIFEPSSVYYVGDGDLLEVYVTDIEGNATKRLPTKEDIAEWINIRIEEAKKITTDPLAIYMLAKS